MGRVRAAVVTFWRKAYEDNLTGLARWWPTTCCSRSSRSRSSRCSSPGGCCARPSCRTRCSLDLQRLFPQRGRDARSTTAVRRLQQTSTTGRHHRDRRRGLVRRRRSGARSTPRSAGSTTASAGRWVHQKLFALGMFGVVLLFIVATVAVPAIQSLLADERRRPAVRALRRPRPGLRRLARGRRRRPVRRAVRRPTRSCPRAGCRGAACGRGRSARRSRSACSTTRFPLYLQNVSTLRVGTTFRVRR